MHVVERVLQSRAARHAGRALRLSGCGSFVANGRHAVPLVWPGIIASQRPFAALRASAEAPRKQHCS
jgi:hypothetical protein